MLHCVVHFHSVTTANAAKALTHLHNLPVRYNASSASPLTSSISVCASFLSSSGERWCQHDRVCVPLQLWDGE